MSRLMLTLAALLVSAAVGASPPDKSREADEGDYPDEEVAEQDDADTDANEARTATRTKYTYTPNRKLVRTKVYRTAVRYHRRAYVHQRYYRNAGPFHRKVLRRPPELRRQQDDDESADD